MNKRNLFIILAILVMLVLSGCNKSSENEPTSISENTVTPTNETLTTSIPTETPTSEPTIEITLEPTASPTETPTVAPTLAPTYSPTPVPTEEPTPTPIPHTHNFTNKIESSEYKVSGKDNEYYYSCVCGEHGTETFTVKTSEPVHTHDFSNQVAKEKYLASEATCTSRASYYYSCSCGEKGTATFEYGEMLAHNYTLEVVSENTLAKEADCCNEAEYFYTCSCGKKGVTTFKYGEKLEHNYIVPMVSDEYMAKAATCTNKAEYYYLCTCGKVSDITYEYGEMLPHTFTEHIMDDQFLATDCSCSHGAKYYVSCKYCSAHSEETFEPENKDLEPYSIIKFKKLPTLDNEGTITVRCEVCGNEYDRTTSQLPSGLETLPFVETKGNTVINTGITSSSELTLNLSYENFFWSNEDSSQTGADEISIFAKSTSGEKLISRFYGGDIKNSDAYLAYYIPAKLDGFVGIYDYVSGSFLVGETKSDVYYIDEIDAVTPFKGESSLFTKVEAVDIFEGNTISLNLYTTYNMEINGISFDGKDIVPDEYENVIFGIDTYCENSKMFSIYGVVVKNSDGTTTHNFVPVKKNDDNSYGLYDEITEEFYPLIVNSNDTFSTEYFKNNAEYNKTLAELAAFYDYDNNYIDKLLTNNGYEKILHYEVTPLEDDTAINEANFDLYKKTYIKEGQLYNLLYLAIADCVCRGEWISNSTLGTGELHEGALATSNFIKAKISEYLTEENSTGKIIITGFGRGGTIASILSADLGDSKSISSKNIFSYTIATSNYSLRTNTYDYIFHIVSQTDVMVYMPSSSWGYRVEGVTIKLPCNEEYYNDVDALIRDYQAANDLEITGYTGLTESVEEKMSVIGDMITLEMAQNKENAVTTADMLLMFSGESSISKTEILKLAQKFNLSSNLSKILSLYSFATNNKAAIKASCSSFVYIFSINAA